MNLKPSADTNFNNVETFIMILKQKAEEMVASSHVSAERRKLPGEGRGPVFSRTSVSVGDRPEPRPPGFEANAPVHRPLN